MDAHFVRVTLLLFATAYYAVEATVIWRKRAQVRSLAGRNLLSPLLDPRIAASVFAAIAIGMVLRVVTDPVGLTIGSILLAMAWSAAICIGVSTVAESVRRRLDDHHRLRWTVLNVLFAFLIAFSGGLVAR